MKAVALILLVVLTLGCHRNTIPPQSSYNLDSVHVENTVRYHDTVIHIPARYIHAAVTLPCREVPPVRKTFKSDGMQLDVDIDKRRMNINCTADSLKGVIVQVRDSLRKETRVKTTIKNVPYPVTTVQYKVPKWMWYVCGALLLVVVIQNRTPVFNIVSKLFKLFR